MTTLVKALAYSLCFSPKVVMSVLWMLLQAPDLAITEAAVGTGVSSVLFFLTLRRVKGFRGTEDDR